MPINVTMPDGTIISNVPEGTTKSQLMARYQKFTQQKQQSPVSPQQPRPQAVISPATATSTPTQPPSQQSMPDPIKQPAQVSPQPPTSPPGLIDRISADVSNRYKQGVDIMGKRNEQNPLSTGLQMAGKTVFGTASDIVGEVGKSAYDSLPESIRKNIAGDPITKAAIVGAQKVGDVYRAISESKWAKKHPEAFANMEAIGDIASFIPLGKAAGMAGKAAVKTAEIATNPIPVVGPLVKGMAAPSVEKIKAGAREATSAASGKIQSAKTSGTVFQQSLAQDLSKRFDDTLDLSNEIKANASKETLASVNRIKNVLSSGDTSFGNLIIERNELTRAASMGGEEALSAKKAIKILDDTIEEYSKKGKISGGDSDAVKKYQQGMKDYGEAKRYENIADALSKGKGSYLKIRSQMSKIIDSGDINYYPKNIQKLIRVAAKGRTSENVLLAATKLSKSLPVVGDLTGLIIGGVTKPMVNTMSKGSVVDILKAIKNE